MTNGAFCTKGYRFPPEIIARAVWLYFRFPWSLRLVEEMLLERGILVGYETIRCSAAEVGQAVIDQMRFLLGTPEIAQRMWRQAKAQMPEITEREVRGALRRRDPLWRKLFPAEPARIVQLLVARVDVDAVGLEIRLRVEGLATLVDDLWAAGAAAPRAAA